MPPFWRCCAPNLLIVLLAGCASYRPLPLDEGKAAARLADIRVSAASMPSRELRTHRFDPADGLDVTEVAMLAVANNPQLRVLRDELGIADAQAFAAGLLPDPQLSLGRDRPTSRQPNLTSAFNLGLSYDLGALLTRSSRVASARQGARQVDLDLLWNEWQTVAKARLLFDQVLTQRRLVALLHAEQTALAPVAKDVAQALAAGNLSYDTASAGLNAAADADNRLADATRQLNQGEHALRALLGLAPAAALDLVGPAYAAAPDENAVSTALAEMTRRRPDLRALQAGYAAQEAKLRGAVLAQFPAISIGFTRARDTSAIYSSGFTIGLNLPLFDRNRGNIAIETATRQRLKDEYAARVQASRSDIDRLAADLATFGAQRPALDAHAAELARARATAAHAYAAGDLDWPTYLAIRANALAAETDRILIEQNAAEQTIALETLVGGDWFADPDSSRRPGGSRDPASFDRVQGHRVPTSAGTTKR